MCNYDDDYGLLRTLAKQSGGPLTTSLNTSKGNESIGIKCEYPHNNSNRQLQHDFPSFHFFLTTKEIILHGVAIIAEISL